MWILVEEVNGVIKKKYQCATDGEAQRIKRAFDKKYGKKQNVDATLNMLFVAEGQEEYWNNLVDAIIHSNKEA